MNCELCSIKCNSVTAFNDHTTSKSHLHLLIEDKIKALRQFEKCVLLNLYNSEDQKIEIETRDEIKETKEVILFYKYKKIEKVIDIAAWQYLICEYLNLKGRIRTAQEGINGSLCGLTSDLDLYITLTSNLFGKDIDFKRSSAPSLEDNSFHSIQSLAVKEIVSMGIDSTLVSAEDGGVHLSPIDFHNKLMECLPSPNTVLIDVRNGYEQNVGFFEGAIKPHTRCFSEFPSCADELINSLHLANDESKDVFMYCTGGIRCERASAYLKKKGVRNVYQLQGGIHRYIEQIPLKESLFKGKNFVFDTRKSQTTNHEGEEGKEIIVGRCQFCLKLYDTYKEENRYLISDDQ